jgi:uncharacterized protein YraI
MRKWKSLALSVGILALSTGWAGAAPVVVLDYLNLRVGPGFDYSVIEVIPVGWVIEAGGCQRGWCQVNVNGIVGYADATYLSGARAPAVYGVPWPYGVYDRRYADWTYPTRDYFYYGYASEPYPDAFADAYAGGGAVGLRADRRRSGPDRRATAAKAKGAPRPTKLAEAPQG